MESFSIWHWIILSIILVIGITPFAMITRKAGYPWYLGLLVVFPILNLIFLWWLATARWPSTVRT